MFSLIISWLRAVNNSPRLSFPHTFSSSVNSLMKDLGHGEKKNKPAPPLPSPALLWHHLTKQIRRVQIADVWKTFAWQLVETWAVVSVYGCKNFPGRLFKTCEMMRGLFLPSWLLNCLIVNLGMNLLFNPLPDEEPYMANSAGLLHFDWCHSWLVSEDSYNFIHW